MYIRLTSGQKWQISFYLLGLFSPLLMYANLPDSARTWATISRILPFIAIFSVINLGLYYIWITAADWWQGRLFRAIGKDFLGEFSGLSLLTTFLMSLILSLLYTQMLHWLLDLLMLTLRTIWPASTPKTHTSPFPPEVVIYIKRANNVFSVVIMLSAFYLMINIRAVQQLKDAQLRAEQFEKEVLMSQFEALKNQLSPHFLFNSLSILSSMVHEDADLSEQYINQLSKVYRYILEQRDQKLVPLKTELEFIRAYTFLLQIRFENKFDVLVDVTSVQQSQYQIAPLSLQLLVENAVKHNRMSIDEPLRVHLYCQNDMLLIENRWQPRDQPETSTGVGLRNIVNRYSLLTNRTIGYGREAESFIVKIPLLP